MSTDRVPWAQRVLATGTPRPGEALEVFTLEGQERRYELGGGKLEQTESRRTAGLAVRVVHQDRLGFAYRLDPSPAAAAAALAEARDLAQYSAPDPSRRLPGPRPPAGVAVPAPVELDAIPAADKVALAQRLAAAALAADPRVRAAHQASYHESETRCTLASTLGVAAAWTRQAFVLGVAALAEAHGDSQLAEEFRVWRDRARLDPEVVGAAAGARAAGLLGATSVPTGRRVLLMPPSVVTGLLEAVLPAWSAEAVQRKRSFLQDQAGQVVAASDISLVDDGTAPNGVGTAPVDDEGTPTQRTLLVSAGRQQGLLHTQETAQRAGTLSTGNAVRAGLASPPGVGPTNVQLAPGPTTPERLWVLAEGGLCLAEVLGLHTLNPVTGEFSVGASGWLVSGGAPGRPVRGVTIAGDVATLLRQVVAVGNDPVTYGRFTAPSLLIRDMMVAGT